MVRRFVALFPLAALSFNAVVAAQPQGPLAGVVVAGRGDGGERQQAQRGESTRQATQRNGQEVQTPVSAESDEVAVEDEERDAGAAADGGAGAK